MFLIIVTMSFRFLWLSFNQAVFLCYQKVVLGKLPPALTLTLILNQTLTLKGVGGDFLGANFSDTQKNKTKIWIFRERKELWRRNKKAFFIAIKRIVKHFSVDSIKSEFGKFEFLILKTFNDLQYLNIWNMYETFGIRSHTLFLIRNICKQVWPFICNHHQTIKH